MWPRTTRPSQLALTRTYVNNYRRVPVECQLHGRQKQQRRKCGVAHVPFARVNWCDARRCLSSNSAEFDSDDAIPILMDGTGETGFGPSADDALGRPRPYRDHVQHPVAALRPRRLLGHGAGADGHDGGDFFFKPCECSMRRAVFSWPMLLQCLSCVTMCLRCREVYLCSTFQSPQRQALSRVENGNYLAGVT